MLKIETKNAKRKMKSGQAKHAGQTRFRQDIENYWVTQQWRRSLRLSTFGTKLKRFPMTTSDLDSSFYEIIADLDLDDKDICLLENLNSQQDAVIRHQKSLSTPKPIDKFVKDV